MRLVHTSTGLLSIAVLLTSACRAPGYTPTSCTTEADCPAGRPCVSGICARPPSCGNGRCDGGESASGCPADCSGAICGDGTCDAGETGETCPDCSVSRTYVFSTMDALSPPGGTETFGFDVDGMPGAAAGLACTAAPDFTSVVTGAGDVDNQLSTLIPTIDSVIEGSVNDAIREEIQAGRLLYMIEIGEIGSFTDDSHVTVHGVMGRPLPGMPVLTDGLGLAPGQTFGIMIDLGTVPGRITGGRLSVSMLELPLSFSAMGTPIHMTIRNLLVGGRFTETGELIDGEVGGSVSVDAVVEIGRTLFAGVDRQTIEAIAQPDLDPDPTGDHCASISAGMAFEAVSATLQ